MIYSKIVGTGSYLPQQTLSNTQLADKYQLDTSHDWIVSRTGIERRHVASGSETTVSMGVSAANNALDMAQMSAQDVDMVVVATCTPDKVFPATACLIQHALGIPPGPAFDVQAACSGFMYGLSVVDQFIRTGMVKRALFIGAETMSRVLNWADRSTCVLFGDGAGAVLLEASETPGILSTEIGADGSQKDILFLDNGSTLQMRGNAVFKLAVNRLGQMARETLQAHDLEITQLDWLVPHQANIRIIQATAEKLELPMERVIITLNHHGNVSAGSIPLALDFGIRSGKIKRGQRLLLEAFGGGLTWGTALIRY